jgi:3-deoxy-7-phosphoheptulonate synthase
MVDASHANCSKDYRRMATVFRDVSQQRLRGTHGVIGAMLESNLTEGSQSLQESLDQLIYGQSITDPCIGWEETEALLLETAQKIRTA